MNQELKTKIKEFTKKYFVYRQNDKTIPDKAKQELAKLGATKPFYAENEAERSIKFSKILNSEEVWIRSTIEVEIRQYFSTNNLTDTLSLLAQIRLYQTNLEERIRRMKEARERKKYEW